MPYDKHPLGVDVEQVRARLLAGVNFEQVHAELMAALGGIAAGKDHCDLVEVPGVGTAIKILYAVQRAVQFLYGPFEPNDIQVVDRAYAKLGETRQSIRKNEVALEILEALIVKTLNLGGSYLQLYRATSPHDKGVAIPRAPALPYSAQAKTSTGQSHSSHPSARSTCCPAASTSARRPVLAPLRINSAANSQCGRADASHGESPESGRNRQGCAEWCRHLP